SWGHLFGGAGVVRLNETMAQAAHDVIALLAWLRTRTTAPIGVMGLSLGGYVAALLAALVPELAFVIPVVAPVCFGDLAHRFMRPGTPGAAFARAELRAAYRVHSQPAHAARLGAEH